MTIIFRNTVCLSFFGLSVYLGAVSICTAGEDPPRELLMANLTEMSIEVLMNVEILSAAKKLQPVSESAAAVFVITSEDIRRSGALTVPDLLRTVPGLQVARINNSKWAISSRGFGGQQANKLLVLIDGRTVYSPLYSGVYWDAQDVMPEDMERIEIVRGPGAALWGANAVNGVISILTKSAEKTQGGLISGGFGSEGGGFGATRYGGRLAETVWYRLYAKYLNRDSTLSADGEWKNDSWNVLRGGGRMDWQVSDRDHLTLQGDIYDGENGNMQPVASLSPPYDSHSFHETKYSGANLLTRWTRTFSGTSEMALQLYYDRTKRTSTVVNDRYETLDLDFQHRFDLGDRQEIIWGGGYRLIWDDLQNTSGNNTFDPESRTTQLFNGFVQDEITLVENCFSIILGAKAEHNDYSGFEFQPGFRWHWKPATGHALWGAVSRAVRTPSRAENDALFYQTVSPPFSSLNPGPVPVVVSFQGSDAFESEELIAYEMGYRFQAAKSFSADIAVFYNDYGNLRTVEPDGIDFSNYPRHVVANYTGANKMSGESYGVEVALDVRVTDRWRLRGAYSFLRVMLHPDADSGDFISEVTEGFDPRHQFSLRSSLDLPWGLEWDIGGRYVDNLTGYDVQSYVAVDTRLSWSPRPGVEFSVVGQNLNDPVHFELAPSLYNVVATEAVRSVYAKLTWAF
ncbi:TonB-dependent receptor plug domain-containing protein [Desulfonema ishimotonii]|uniref:TonB-dependent receptor plug domain-containing protein n=1 Tax=Desulfonema ishimotonii TaxID=45657 RepID=UPI001407755A|nr:TonB-dependent receptor [Desulfonema ishimotonii]